ncbi:MAG: SDR family oxidoreductase [Proteobacteria bacterium]|nr:MAG: SDR family oxidoreductase [Pseudomonadota bacterium]
MESGKRYVIAGASSGIGFALAKMLSAAGNDVIALARSEKELNGLNGVRFVAYDFLGSEPMPEISDPIDGLVYCPGSITLKPFQSLKDDDLLHDFKLNVLGAFNFIKHYLPNLKKSEAGSIVLFSSVAAQTAMPYHTSVSTVKAGVEGLTKALSAEFAPKIRVNCIAPSLTDTPLASQLLNSDAKRTANAERHPLKTLGDPENIAKVAAFLLTDATWTTGQVWGVNGGLGTIIK